jgi:hypothetical protein
MTKGIYLPKRPYYALNFATGEIPKTVKAWFQFIDYETEIFALLEQDGEYFLFHRKTYERNHWFGIKLDENQARQLEKAELVSQLTDFWEEHKYY